MIVPQRYLPIAVTLPAIVMMAGSALAAVYLTVEEAQQLIFPSETLTSTPIILSAAQRDAIQKSSGVPIMPKIQRVWQSEQGGFLVIDDVIGKHELITYAVGINPDGSLRQVEIMEYREAYGYEIRKKKWLKQFVGKTSAASFQLNRDIKNISGATLSCRHVTEGVKRVMALYEIVLKK